MQLVIIAVGQRMPSWVVEGYGEYVKRLPDDIGLELREVKAEPRSGTRSASAAMALEAERIRAVVPRNAHMIVLDEQGRDLTSAGLSAELQRWRERAVPVALVIGGADGLDPDLKRAADATLRVSSFTLPHGLVRVLLAEQIYRAWSIIQHHPYHRA